jgi:L-amino acid N-acyltransferase YncA
MNLLRQMWAAQAARNEKPSPVWVAITETGELAHWAVTRYAAQKTAARFLITCYIARLDPHSW